MLDRTLTRREEERRGLPIPSLSIVSIKRP